MGTKKIVSMSIQFCCCAVNVAVIAWGLHRGSGLIVGIGAVGLGACAVLTVLTWLILRASEQIAQRA